MYNANVKQCLGIQPYRFSPYVPTTELASTIIRSISGDPNDENAYKRHLALFVSVYVLLYNLFSMPFFAATFYSAL